MKKYWIAIDINTKKIKATGTCHDEATFNNHTAPTGCELKEFVGGVIGQYFVNSNMQPNPPQ